MSRRLVRDIVVVKIKAANSNFLAEDTHLSKWRLEWRDSVITAISTIEHYSDASRIFQELEQPEALGLIIDVCTIATEVTLASRLSYVVYRGSPALIKDLHDPSVNFDRIRNSLRTQTRLETGSEGQEYPQRIDESHSITIDDVNLTLSSYVLKSLGRARITKADMKLLNYWRRGHDLENFSYYEESFLAYFKILEYFRNRGTGDSDGDRVVSGAGLNTAHEIDIPLLNQFFQIRNNFDVAHVRIRPLPVSRTGALHFAYIPNVWDTHDHLKMVTMLLLLNKLGVVNIMLEESGGLLHLKQDEAT